jgi:hypothetical protein
VVAVDVRHSICLIAVQKVPHPLGFDLDLFPTIIICNYHIGVLFLLFDWVRNMVNDVVKAVDIMLKLSDGVLCLL